MINIADIDFRYPAKSPLLTAAGPYISAKSGSRKLQYIVEHVREIVCDFSRLEVGRPLALGRKLS